MNLPNKLTFSRILLVPVFMVFMVPLPNWIMNAPFLLSIHEFLVSANQFVENYGKYIAAGLFIIASCTDGLDGYIARKRNQITMFGKFMDPIADKLLISAALIALAYRNDISAWSALVIIGREIFVTGIRLIAVGEGVVISASWLGKLKTFLQIVAISAILLKDYPIAFIFPGIYIGKIFMFFAIVITLLSAFDYIKKNKLIIFPIDN